MSFKRGNEGKKQKQPNPNSSQSEDQPKHNHKRSQQKERARSRSRSRSRDRLKKKTQQMKAPEENTAKYVAKEIAIDPDVEVTDDLLQSVLGFSGFSSSKGKDHSSSSVECVQKNSQVRRKYRQYMNRWGGFNRKLDQMN